MCCLALGSIPVDGSSKSVTRGLPSMLRAKQSWGTAKGQGEDTRAAGDTPTPAAPPYLAFQPHAQLLRGLLQVVF